MKVRKATKFDLPKIIEMLHRYKLAGPTNISNAFDNEDHVTILYAHIMAGKGLALVSEKDNVITGMLLAMVDSIIWDPDTRIMRELAYWVDEEYRGSSAGYRLLSEYVKQANEMVDEGRINAYVITKMANSPDLKYDKFGFTKTEEIWVAGV